MYCRRRGSALTSCPQRMNEGFVLNYAVRGQTMSAAISDQWWAAKGLLTKQAKDGKKKKKNDKKHGHADKHRQLGTRKKK